MKHRGKFGLREALVVSRPFWWPNTAVPFIVGGLLAGVGMSPQLIIGAIYFLIPYNLLMYGVNDIYDYESDMRNPRKNGSIDGSVLPKSKHAALRKWMWWSNWPLLAYLMLTGNFESNAVLLVMLYLVFAYSVAGLRFKEIPFVDSLTSAFHYTSPFFFALLYFSSENMFVGITATFYLWVVANHAFGAIQDIKPDREAKIASIATKLGSANTLIFVIVLYLLAMITPLIHFGTAGLIGTAMVAPYLLVALGCWRDRQNPDATTFARGWKRFLVLNYAIGAVASIAALYLYNR